MSSNVNLGRDGTARLIALTNDDGIDAPGLAALERAVRRLEGVRVVVVAPGDHCSGCGHRVTQGPLRVEERGPDRYAVFGTPVDCTRVAFHHLRLRPDWVLSGINAGGNLGVDVFHSGTVSACREAAIHGVPSIALSHYIARDRRINWDHAAEWTARLLERLLERIPEPGSFWNLNLPHLDHHEVERVLKNWGQDGVTPWVECFLDPSPHDVAYHRHHDGSLVDQGDYQRRPRRPGGDIEACFSGKVSLTKLRVGETHA